MSWQHHATALYDRKQSDPNLGQILHELYRNIGTLNRHDYKVCLAHRSFAIAWTSNAIKSGCRAPGEPELRNPLSEAQIREKADAFATAEAAAIVDSYVAKLQAKIGAEVADGKVSGDLWSGSALDVVLADGSRQRWTTKCIVNVSCLGKVFNQWPTRRAE